MPGVYCLRNSFAPLADSLERTTFVTFRQAAFDPCIGVRHECSTSAQTWWKAHAALQLSWTGFHEGKRPRPIRSSYAFDFRKGGAFEAFRAERAKLMIASSVTPIAKPSLKEVVNSLHGESVSLQYRTRPSTCRCVEFFEWDLRFAASRGLRCHAPNHVTRSSLRTDGLRKLKDLLGR